MRPDILSAKMFFQSQAYILLNTLVFRETQKNLLWITCLLEEREVAVSSENRDTGEHIIYLKITYIISIHDLLQTKKLVCNPRNIGI